MININNKIQNIMSNNNSVDNGLLGFLQKKSLFQTEGTRRVPRKRTNSRTIQDRNSIINKISSLDDNGNYQNNQQQYQPQLYQNQQQNYQYQSQPAYFSEPQVHNHPYTPKESSPPHYQTSVYQRDNNNFSSMNNGDYSVFHSHRTSPQNYVKKVSPNRYGDITMSNRMPEERKMSGRREVRDQREPDFMNKMIQGVAMYSMNFQSARVESAQCLETLSFKLKAELSNVNYRMEQFRTNMARTLSQDLRGLKDKLVQMIQQAFKESERAVREYMQVEEQKLGADLLRIKQALESECMRVQTMKEQIARPQWRKVAGQILSTEMQKNVQNLISQSSSLQIKPWPKRQWNSNALNTLAMNIKELVKMKQ